MQARELTQALGGRWRGTSGMAPCPAHDDRRPSLSITAGDDGQVLWHCHAGCSQQAVQNALIERGLLAEKAGRATGHSAKRLPVATYDYKSPDGEVLFQVLRYAPKAFGQRRPGKAGRWIWKLNGIEPVPYRLPELLGNPGQIVFIVEGEKDVESLLALGLAATCNPGGAGKWREAFADYFVGRDVVVLPDNDEQGKAHGHAVARSLVGVAKSVRFLDLPGLPPKGDPADWIRAGGTADELRRLAERLPPYDLNANAQLEDWYSSTIPGRGGQVLPNHTNIMLALREDAAWKGVFGFDEMRQQVMLLKPIPCHGKSVTRACRLPRPWSDDDDRRALEWMQIAGFPTLSRDTVSHAIAQCARELAFHPVRELLEALEWDGVPRLQGGTTDEGEILQPFLAAYFGAKDTAYCRAVGTMWMISVVARIFEPGCKVDHMLILEGPQGIGKSTACRLLCGEEYFSDNLPDIVTKDAAAHLSGKWIIEVAELDAFSRAENARMKAFLTRRVDKFRAAYARHEDERPRQCVFIGTTNKQVYLKDETGGRRYWPVGVTAIDLEALAADREQLWAEAVHLYRQGHPWHVTDPELHRLIEAVQAKRYDADVWEERIFEYLKEHSQVTVGEVMNKALSIETPKCNRRDQNRVMKVLDRLGWKRANRKDSRGCQLRVRPED